MFDAITKAIQGIRGALEQESNDGYKCMPQHQIDCILLDKWDHKVQA